jgi:hypothetical protein
MAMIGVPLLLARAILALICTLMLSPQPLWLSTTGVSALDLLSLLYIYPQTCCSDANINSGSLAALVAYQVLSTLSFAKL